MRTPRSRFFRPLPIARAHAKKFANSIHHSFVITARRCVRNPTRFDVHIATYVLDDERVVETIAEEAAQ